MNQINQFVGLTGNTANDLTYIYKIMNLFEKFTNEEIFEWYCGLTRRNKDIKVNDKPSVSINYVLLSNPDVHHIMDDKFLTTLLIDCVDQIEISEELELRIVDIINCSHANLHKYVHRYANRLNFQIKTNEIIKINNDCAYYMSQDVVTRTDSVEVFRKLLLKLKDQRYKEEVEKYIKSQGIINETIFIHAIVSDVHSYRYISNIDIRHICKLICYKHLSKFIDRSIITQQFLISKNYLNCILKYSRLVEIENDLIKKLEAPSFLTKDEFILILLYNRTKLKQNEIQTIIDQRSLLLLEYLIKIEFQLSGMLTRDILQLENKFNLNKIYEKHGFELVKKGIEAQTNKNLEIYERYKKLFDVIYDQETLDLNESRNISGCPSESALDLVDKNFYQLICKTKSYLYLEEGEQIKLVEYFSGFINLDDLMPLILDLKQTSNKINEFFIKNLDQINNSEYKNILYDDNAKVVKIKPEIVKTKNGQDVLKTLEALCTTKIDVLVVESFLRELFSDYCFDFYGDYLPRVIKNFQKEEKICRVIFRIQENVINILEIGFFNPNYFVLIKNILNTIIKYRVQDNCSFCSKVRKNNDKIIILLSYFTQFFDKNFQIGNVNKKNNP